MFGRRFRRRDNRAKQHRAKHSNTDQLRPGYRRRLRLEPLEDRRVLSGILHVDADATGSMTGLSWPDAFDDLQPALSAAETLNTDADPSNDITAIWIAEGTYKPTAQLEVDDVRTATFSLIPDVDLIGGFAGNETAPDQRPLADGKFQHPTILSGDLGVIDDKADNAYTVVYGDLPEGTETTIDGLTITAGNADGDDNLPPRKPPHRCQGGGVYATGSGELTVTKSTISGNSARYRGGGIHSDEGTLTVMNSTLAGNSAGDQGGGVFTTEATLTITNSTLSGNSARYHGGGVLSAEATLTITNSTLSGNSAGDGGGIYHQRGGTLTVNNTIVALNETDGAGTSVFGDWSGTANLIGIDPQFMHDPSPGADGEWGTEDDDYGDLRLTDMSPAVNHGSNESAVDGRGVSLEADRHGAARVVDGTVDIGAYEYQSALIMARETPSTLVDSVSDIIDLYDGQVTLREALVYASTDLLPNEITFAPSLFADGPATLTLQRGAIELRDDLTIIGPGDDLLTFDAGNRSRVFYIGGTQTDVVLNGLKITGGLADQGGGIHNNRGTLTVANSTISENRANSVGGGIYSIGMSTITNSTLSGNAANVHGGGAHSAGTLTVTNSMLSRNWAGQSVAGISSSGTLVVTNSTFSGNRNSWGGGGIGCSNGTAMVTSCVFVGNHVSRVGGGGIDNGALTMTVTNCTFTENSVTEGSGGGILSTRGILTVTNSTFSMNSAAGRPGTWWNRDGSGGAIYSSGGTLIVTNSTLTGNWTTHGSGGGIYSRDGTLTVTDSTLSGNSAGDDGGGICSRDGTLTVANSTISGNSATNEGGGIRNDRGTLTVMDSTLSGNSANWDGGGICSRGGTFTVTNSTISGNSTTRDHGSGGGIYTYAPGGSVTIDNSIVARNGSSEGPDVFHEFGTVSGANNLIGNGADQSALVDGVNGNLVGTSDSPIDPRLSDFIQFNNGQWGYLLLPDSPAIDAGDSDLAVDVNGDPLALDQRGEGHLRIVGKAVDIGAVEMDLGAVDAGFLVGRHLFYNNSSFDHTADSDAIATDKKALLTGEPASRKHYSGYTRGINGIIVDSTGNHALSAIDFAFRVGNGDDTTDWSKTPDPISIQTEVGAGIGGSARTTIIWEDYTIANTWLQVTILANENTGLAEPDVFYFGNAVGETGNDPDNAMVTVADELLVRNNRRGLADRATIEDPYDFNRDGLVNAADRIVARNNRTGFGDALKLITPGASELLENGGVETGDFTGWTATSNGRRKLTPWTVGPAGGGFFFDSSPLEGNYSAYNGFDGQAGLVYELKQTVDMPSTEDLLAAESWLVVNYRVVTAFGTKNALGRKVEVLVRDENGDLLDTLYSWEITPQPGKKVDLGWNRVALRMPGYFGQTIEICLREEIPETDTGPGLIEWDDLSLTVIAAP